MSINVDIQNVSGLNTLPTNGTIISWVKQALDEKHKQAEITIRVVDIDEGQALNKKWREKNHATNVLSFPVGEPIEQAPNLLGDIVICAPIVAQQAKQQGKTIDAHWAHLIIHGILHLQGYDHTSDKEADIMESKEIKILEKIGYRNPYQTESE